MDPDTLAIVYLTGKVVAAGCQILVVIFLFTDEGFLRGVFGLLCGLYAFYWGWKEWDSRIRTLVMAIWTLALATVIYLKFGYGLR